MSPARNVAQQRLFLNEITCNISCRDVAYYGAQSIFYKNDFSDAGAHADNGKLSLGDFEPPLRNVLHYRFLSNASCEKCCATKIVFK